MKISRTASFAIGAVAALVLGSGTAYAATGGKFILGSSNTATKTTILTNSRGTALSLKSKAGTASLAVNSPTKVTNLNADRLDNLDSTSFALASGNVKAFDVTGTLHDFNNNGLNDTIVATATCPAGSRRTGGGGTDVTTSGYMFSNGPDSPNSWTVGVAISESTTEDPTNVTASIVCYSPRGIPAGTGYRAAASTGPSSALLAKFAHRVNH
ncbi:MAG: hypothetical protein JWR52_357 [Marmoricola sp.]|nr:hypothetical protein [Marmoricola sp.]